MNRLLLRPPRSAAAVPLPRVWTPRSFLCPVLLLRPYATTAVAQAPPKKKAKKTLGAKEEPPKKRLKKPLADAAREPPKKKLKKPLADGATAKARRREINTASEPQLPSAEETVTTKKKKQSRDSKAGQKGQPAAPNPQSKSKQKKEKSLAATETAPAKKSPRRSKAAEVVEEKKPVEQPPQLKLRDYQEECIQSVLMHVDEGHRRMGISLATGAGKTVVFTQLISRLSHPTNPKKATQTLIIAHRVELVTQAYNHVKRQYPHLTVEIEMAKQHSSGVADITIASVYSLASGDRLGKFDPARFKLILIDECHHAVAGGYLHTLDHFGLLKNKGDPEGPLDANSPGAEKRPILVGVSATMSRFDGIKLGKVMDYIVYHRDYVDMIKDQWLCPVQFTTVQTNVNLSRVRNGASGDFLIGDLSKAVNTDQANEIVVRTWMGKAGNRKSTLVFCVDIAHVTEITNKFRTMGINAKSITGHTPTKERRDLLDRFRAGEYAVLVNCGVFTEGTDIPNIDCVLLARPTRSRNLLVQMIGRGMRLHPAKTDVHVIDMVGSIERGIVTVPTLMGLDPDDMLEEATMEDLERLKEARERARLREEQRLLAQAVPLPDAPPVAAVEPAKQVDPRLRFTHYDTVFDLIEDARQDTVVRTLSRFAWVAVDKQRYVLSCGGGGYVRIDSEEGAEGAEGADPDATVPRLPTFAVTETRKLPMAITGNPHMRMRPRVIASGLATLEHAVHVADTFAKSKYANVLLTTHAPWRMAPPSKGQLTFLADRVPGAAAVIERQGAALTKGKAADMITKFRLGAKARFERMQTEARKEGRMLARLEKAKSKEAVAVGRIV